MFNQYFFIVCHQHNPLHCIIPPYMVERIVENGTTSQVNKARSNLSISAEIRGRRQNTSGSSGRTATDGQKIRRIYDAQNGSELPGILVRDEGQPATGDKAVDEAYDGSGATYDLFYDIFERNSIDDNGIPLISIVHYLQGYDNAFWDGSKMVYGDGDEDLPPAERLFNRFTIAIDIIGHELAHGVNQYEANLVYQDQPGALNESFSDIFGSLVKQRINNQTSAQADWLIGEGLFTDNVNGQAIRSMKNPGSAYDDPVLGKDPQPGHMDEYVQTTSDNGGVHINSGIPNKAFYEMAMEMGGYAWEKAGKIWYLTLKEKLNNISDFQSAANFTYETAGELYGVNSNEQKSVENGWNKVGISIEKEVPDPEVPDQQSRTGCAGIFLGLLGIIG